jgi:hypothetical protein
MIRFAYAGPMGGACGSSCQAGEGVGWTSTGDVRDTISKLEAGRREPSSESNTGTWARRTGSGIPVD